MRSNLVSVLLLLLLLFLLLLPLYSLLQQSGKQQVLSHRLNTAVGLRPENIG